MIAFATWQIVLGAFVGALFVFALLAGSVIYSAIGAAHDLEDSEEAVVSACYSARRRRRARAKGALAAERGWPPSMCPYKAKDEPLRQEWLSWHILVRLKRLRPLTSDALPARFLDIHFLNGGQSPLFLKGADASTTDAGKNRRRSDTRCAG